MALDIHQAERGPEMHRRRRGRSVETRKVPLTPIGYHQFALDVANPVNLNNVAGTGAATVVSINVEAQALRYTDDGSAPRAGFGMLIPVGATFTVTLSDVGAVMLAAEVAGAIANVSFYGQFR